MWMKVMWDIMKIDNLIGFHVNEGNVFSLIWLVCVNEGNECVQFNLIGLCEWR